MGQFVVQITSNCNGRDLFASGTGVIIAPYLALAARHVLEDPRTTHGEVVEVHVQGRDQRLPVPCFRTNAQIDGGMSGGPVLTTPAGSADSCVRTSGHSRPTKSTSVT